MRSSRVFFIITFASIAAAGHAATAAPADLAFQSGDQTFRLSAAAAPYLVLQFLDPEASPNAVDRLKQYVASGTSLAGVMHLFILPESSEPQRRALAERLSISTNAHVKVLGDDGARGARAIGLGAKDGKPSELRLPALVVMGPDRKEVFRHSGRDSQDVLPFSEFSARFDAATRNPDLPQFNLKGSDPAVQGYDVVSYFASGAPQKGRKEIPSRYRGVTCWFATEAHRAAFNADPEKYLPEYGGWCATAMAEGRKVEIDSSNFKITGGRLFLFYKGWLGNAQKDWNKDEANLTHQADAAWKKIAPRDADMASGDSK